MRRQQAIARAAKLHEDAMVLAERGFRKMAEGKQLLGRAQAKEAAAVAALDGVKNIEPSRSILQRSADDLKRLATGRGPRELPTRERVGGFPCET